MVPRRIAVFAILLALALCATASAGKKKAPAKPVNINTAKAEELEQVPGIGPATAQKILRMRKSYGPFKSVDDLLAISRPGPKAPRQNAQVLDGCKQSAKIPTAHDKSLDFRQTLGKAAR